MRAGVAYCRGLSDEGLCFGRTRRDLAGRRHGPPGDSPLHHHASLRVAAAVPCDIAVGAYRDHRGIFLFFAAQELLYQWLWVMMAGGMIAKGAFLSIGPHSWRRLVIDWCVGRKDIDYRFCGLSLSALALLLLHALGWAGRS
jgi:hypothetical protein